MPSDAQKNHDQRSPAACGRNTTLPGLRRSAHHKATPRKTLAAASCAAPTQKGESPAAPKYWVVPLVPHNTPASATSEMPCAADDGAPKPTTDEEEAAAEEEEGKAEGFMLLWCACERPANVEKRLHRIYA